MIFLQTTTPIDPTPLAQLEEVIREATSRPVFDAGTLFSTLVGAFLGAAFGYLFSNLLFRRQIQREISQEKARIESNRTSIARSLKSEIEGNLEWIDLVIIRTELAQDLEEPPIPGGRIDAWQSVGRDFWHLEFGTQVVLNLSLAYEEFITLRELVSDIYTKLSFRYYDHRHVPGADSSIERTHETAIRARTKMNEAYLELDKIAPPLGIKPGGGIDLSTANQRM